MVRRPSTIHVGTAGWSLPREAQPAFPAEGTHLERYAARLPAVEINSSFYRPHRPSTYARWAASVPPAFRFAVKVPKTITHAARLVDGEPLLDAFLAEATALGDRLGCLLVQLPPSLAFDAAVAGRFFRALRGRFDGDVAIEPRHATWFVDEAEALLRESRVARVAADPPRDPRDGVPAGWAGLVYYRLHGSPRIYYSDYDATYLATLAERLAAHARTGTAVWCIFDNTALGAATANALDVTRRIAGATG
jgi:uncharacterized protein YecE (DUF72 family)